MTDTVRGGLLACTCLEVLADAEGPLPAAEVITRVGSRCDRISCGGTSSGCGRSWT